MTKQKGVSLSGLLIGCVILIVLALLAIKVAPPYMEYLQIKKAVAAIIESGEVRTATVADVRKAFDRRAQIDDITSVTGQDLEITKDGGEVVISFAYPKKIGLFSNISLLFDFAGSSKR
ncbi:MAG: hypothetical protein A3I01_02140 [Betaproteobacteria bacterium RIFCSPLOWO2_02_FULL_65_24]|nr:MAG: hypothetical protein A3I01_02140 [Betaproteobacteria bacterium RIFCSPLOWO2_02_FULL_65_24]OGA95724.1 MAG: hypothetical protein A3G27_10235 [Betaproteobacteria bacterium RIFCSPLOWO2_12_FULL_66_14]